MASATEKDSYDLCITVESLDTPVTGWNLWSGYENLSMAELNHRFKYWNTECKYGNMDIAEAAVKVTDSIGELTHLPKRNFNDYSTLQKWLKHFHSVKCTRGPTNSDTSSELRKKHNSPSAVKSLRQREIMGAAGPTQQLLPVECFKNMKFSEQQFSQDLCRARHLLFDHRGKHIIIASFTNQVQIWNLVTFQHENLIVCHGYDFHHIRHMELSTDDSLLVVGTNEGVVAVWDYKRRVELATEKISDSYFKHFKLLPEPINGNYCLATMNPESRMTMWRLHYPKVDDGSKVIVKTYEAKPQMTLQPPDYPEFLVATNRCYERKRAAIFCTFSVSSCGRYMARSTANSKIRVYTHDQNFRLVRFSSKVLPQKNIDEIIWAHHSPRFIMSSRLNHTKVWDVNFKIALTLEPKEKDIAPGMANAYWSADDVWVITSAIGYTCIYVWDSVEGTIVNVIQNELGRVVPHPVLPQLLATIVFGEIQLWDLTRTDGQEVHTFYVDHHFNPCDAKAVVWSPDGTVLIAPRSDGMLIMLNLSKGIPAIYAPTRAERLERRRNKSTSSNILSNADTSNISSLF